MEMFNNMPVIPFSSSATWEVWLSSNYELQTGVWIKVAKKDTGIESITHPEALDVALCYGWIDGQRRGLDDIYYLQKFTPRRRSSLWSKVNIAKVESLIDQGHMQAPGLREIEMAQADGRWDGAYESQKNATIPDDLLAIFEKNKSLRDYFDSLTKANRYAVLWRLMTAKTPKTRAARLQKILEMLESKTPFH